MRHGRAATSGSPNPSSASKANNKQAGKLNAAGKVVLAAIVHHDTICHESIRANELKSTHQHQQLEVKNCPAGSNKQTAANTHDEQERDGVDASSCKGAGKLSKLFWKKKPTATLIDKAQNGNNSKAAPSGQQFLPEPNELASEPTGCSQHFTPIHQRSRSRSNGRKTSPSTTTFGSQQDREQVIEFKFDLIVDQTRASQHPTDYLNTTSWLDADVNQLVESFVLDSNDVCLMSTGKQQVRVEGDEYRSRKLGGDVGEFAYLAGLASHTLKYSFQLLASRQSQASCLKSAGNNYSVELSATLMLSEPIQSGAQEEPAQEGLYSIVDLLMGSGDLCPGVDDSAACLQTTIRNSAQQKDSTKEGQNFPISSSAASTTTSSIDCSNLTEALGVIERVKARLNEFERSRTGGAATIGNKLLLIGLKLKQRINGGLFSNRMCLIDFDPKFLELQTIFESIFNGQALAHLKRHKLHLQSLESMFKTDVQFSGSTSGKIESNKQHHLVASEHKLIQAEWLLYKQLSSALIRTLIMVHVHKLSPATKDVRPLDSLVVDYEHRLMRDNLVLLEFARKIRKASSVRLKRRKRNLRSHLASSNVSLASNASATTTTNELLGGSPVRQRRSSASRQTSQLDFSKSRKNSLDVSLALSRLHRRHHQHNHHHHNHHHNHSSRLIYATSHADRKQYLDCTESSSMSTSSGSQTRRMQSASHRFRDTDREASTTPFNNFSDSDSITSANLNSCSSSSYLSRLAAGGHQRSSARQRQDIELKWMAKGSRTIQHQDHQIAPAAPNESSFRSPLALAGRRQRSSSISSQNLIQIDCHPLSGNCAPPSPHDSSSSKHVSQGGKNLLQHRTNPGNAASLEDNSDNVSDICSVIAEPPKQLKLEEFLNQLSSIIAPITLMDQATTNTTAASASSVRQISSKSQLPAPYSSDNTGARSESGRRNEVDEDDEDCKSHSSILDHLSSLAFESNSRLGARPPANPLNGALPEHFHPNFMPEPPPPLLNDCPPIQLEVGDLDAPKGHLQRLLDSSSQLRQSSRVVVVSEPETVEDKLRALAISCNQSTAPASPSSSSGAFTSSNDSSCSSSSTESKRNKTHSSIPKVQKAGLYASVNHRQNVKT